MCFCFCFCFFSWFSCKCYELCSRIKNCVITARFKKHKSIIKKKKHDEIILLEKSELNNLEVLISKVLTDSNISHGGFVLVNNVLKEFEGTKKEIKNF